MAIFIEITVLMEYGHVNQTWLCLQNVATQRLCMFIEHATYEWVLLQNSTNIETTWCNSHSHNKHLCLKYLNSLTNSSYCMLPCITRCSIEPLIPSALIWKVCYGAKWFHLILVSDPNESHLKTLQTKVISVGCSDKKMNIVQNVTNVECRVCHTISFKCLLEFQT